MFSLLGPGVQSVFGKLKSHKLCGTAKKKCVHMLVVLTEEANIHMGCLCMQEVLLAGYKNDQLTLLISREGNWVAGGQGEQRFHCKIFLCFLNSEPRDWSPFNKWYPAFILIPPQVLAQCSAPNGPSVNVDQLN